MQRFSKEDKIRSMIAAGEVRRTCPHLATYDDGELEGLEFYIDIKSNLDANKGTIVIWNDVCLETCLSIFGLGLAIGEGDDFYDLCLKLEELYQADGEICPNCDKMSDELISVCHTADAVCPDCAAEVEHDLAVYAMEANHAFINGGM